jgi:hypothetical protein
VIARAIVLVAILVSAAIFVAVDSHSHSVSDTFYGMVVPEGIVLIATALGLAAVRRLGRGPA